MVYGVCVFLFALCFYLQCVCTCVCVHIQIEYFSMYCFHTGSSEWTHPYWLLLSLGRVPDIPVGEDPSEHMAQAGKTEIELTLSPKAEMKTSEDDDTDMKALFVR